MTKETGPNEFICHWADPARLVVDGLHINIHGEADDGVVLSVGAAKLLIGLLINNVKKAEANGDAGCSLIARLE